MNGHINLWNKYIKSSYTIMKLKYLLNFKKKKCWRLYKTNSICFFIAMAMSYIGHIKPMDSE